MEKINLVNYIKTHGIDIVDEAHKRIKEVQCVSFNIDDIKCDTKIDDDVLCRYTQQYLSIWRSRLLNTVYTDVSRRLVVTDSNDCISVVQLLIRDGTVNMFVYFRSCDVIKKLQYDIKNIKIFLTEALKYFQLTKYNAVLIFGSLHYFLEDL